jgi:protein involved in polysaccharide export with SLBB domain
MMEPFPHKLSHWSRRAWLALALVGCALSGCTAMTNPVADGIPVRLLPPELIGPSKTCWQTIPLTALRQPPTDVYRLAAGDVLGVFIDGYLGASTQPLPVQAAPPVLVRDQNRLPPGAGYPITVQEDGLIAHPTVPKLKVDGMSVGEARDAIRNLYLKKELIKAENERILVTLLYARQAQVLVFRQEATAFQAGQDGPIPISKRNTGHLVDLPAHENDVLHALARTGGLPDLDAYNEIIIYRDYARDKNLKVDLKQLDKGKPGAKQPQDVWVGETVRIPLRLPPEAALPFGKDDVVLHTGDVVFLEARDEQVFFTAGLLPPGKHMLPRDHDLDVLEAVALVRGSLYNGAFGGSNLSGTLIQPGLGGPSPSLLVVLRRVPGRGQVPIAVDLRSAMQHPQERIPLRPGDVLVLQEKPGEAFARYMTQTFFNFNMFYNVFNSSKGVGIIDVATPDRLPGRVGTLNTLP